MRGMNCTLWAPDGAAGTGQAPTTAGDQASPASTAATPATSAATAQPSGATEESEKFDAKYVKELRAEAAGYRKRLQELEAKAKADDDAKLSEIDRAKKAAADAAAKVQEYETSLRTERVQRSVERAAVKLNLDPELAAELVRPDMLEYDDGKPSNTEKVLQGLIKKWPNLVKQAPTAPNINAGDGRGSGATGTDPKVREQELRTRFRI